MTSDQTKHDAQKTNSSSYDGQLSARPAICVSGNPSSLVPRSCHGDSFGILPAGHREVTVMLMLICASQNCRTGSDLAHLLLSVSSGWWNFSVLIGPVTTPVVNWWGTLERMSMKEYMIALPNKDLGLISSRQQSTDLLAPLCNVLQNYNDYTCTFLKGLHSPYQTRGSRWGTRAN